MQVALVISDEWTKRAKALTKDLCHVDADDRSEFISNHRDETWAAPELTSELKKLVGEKCWYTEVALLGADHHIDHFRPKGAVREVDENLKSTKTSIDGYWWLAFELDNYRLSCAHANLRRVDEHTDGGKWDYFPVAGTRAISPTPTKEIAENKLLLDPVSASDVSLLWFDSDGTPSCSIWERNPNDFDKRRVDATIWLYHLNKDGIKGKRGKAMQSVKTAVKTANTQYRLWNRESDNPNEQSKNEFDNRVAEIRSGIEASQEFAGAKRCMLKTIFSQDSEYSWIEEFVFD